MMEKRQKSNQVYFFLSIILVIGGAVFLSSLQAKTEATLQSSTTFSSTQVTGMGPGDDDPDGLPPWVKPYDPQGIYSILTQVIGPRGSVHIFRPDMLTPETPPIFSDII